MSYAAVAAGADGVMTEVHENPVDALCDGKQAITPEVFGKIVKGCTAVKDTLAPTDQLK